ncbi:MAG: Gfo/Idh/MocA family oxidoreductase [Lentisphaerae bacterium]|nr:Gfo/Idh/MocA family oxidoreductase [Lentisphaerota bacterium]
MKTAPLRIGIVGSKFAANFHVASYRNVTGVKLEVAGAFSRSRENREAFAAKWNLKPFSSLEELLQSVDVVDLCVPGALHETLTVQAANAGRHVVVEKPFTGAYGPGAPDWRGDRADKHGLLQEALTSTRRMIEAARKNNVKLLYAENWVYAPSLQKEVEILRATRGQILWIHAEESHSGSHSPAYGDWSLSGGGSLVGKGCHPLSAALYLKRVEGEARLNRPIRPKTVSCRTHAVTRLPSFASAGFLRTDYKDIEDFAHAHITFDDGMIADIFTSELVMGGVHNWMEIYANNHRMRCNINPTDACTLYNPQEKQLENVYVTEKLGTKQGWSFPSPDENWATGYPQELQDFMESLRDGREPQSGASLAADTVSCLYAGYVSAQEHGRETEIPLIA